MDNKIRKCSLNSHNEIDAIYYCQECKIYICNKCEKLHSGLFLNHHLFNLGENIDELFTGFCKIKNHQNQLDYFCKTHNELCCANCITKIKSKGNGQHTDCNICNIEDIIDEKKNKLVNNIKILEDLSNTFLNSINEMKLIIDKINNNKEELKISIQKSFTKLRNAINDRENELILEVDKQFEKIYSDNILNQSEKLTHKIQYFLEKGKNINKDLEKNNDKLKSFINDCINIENYITHINALKKSIEKCNLNSQINFENSELNMIEMIKQYGAIKNIIDLNSDINININEFNTENIRCSKKISDNCGIAGYYYIYDSICCFKTKKNENIVAYIDNKSKDQNIIFYDIDINKEIKKIVDAHKNRIYIVKHYESFDSDIILTSSLNNDIKLWNYYESLNILTISNIFKGSFGVFSSAVLFEKNIFYIFCIGNKDYIKIYDSFGQFYKNIGNNDESRRYIDIFEIDKQKYIISGGNKGVNVFNYPSFTFYNCFIEDKDTNYHSYGKIIKIKDIYNLIDVGDSNKIRIWDFNNKILIKSITSSNENGFGGFIIINNLYLLIGSFSSDIQVYNIKSGLMIKQFKKHKERILGIKSITDKNNKQYFLSYGQDRHIYLWELS